MAQRKITSSGITENIEFQGDSITIPAGTTAERPATAAPGMMRYNTTLGLIEQYNSTGWQGIDSPPTLSSYTGIINENTNSTITVNGTNFKAGSVVYIEGAAVDGSPRALTTTYISSTQLTAATNATSVNYVGNSTYDIKVINPSGLSATLSPAGTIDRDPIWSTGAGTLATILDEYDSYSPITTVSASDPDGTSIAYSISSGTLPNNVSLNSSNGQITGNPQNVSASTTYTFEVTATSNNQSVPRTFNIIVNPAADGSTAARAATSATAVKSLTGTSTSGLFWLKPAGWTYPAQFYCEMNLNGGGWIYILQRQCYSTGTSNSSLPGSWLTTQTGTQNHASSNFSGVTDSNGATKTPQDIWNAFIGSGNNGKWYAREIQTSNGSYDESQRYVGSSDNAIFSWTNFARHFSGNYSNGSWVSGVRVYYNNGSNYVDGKLSTTWSAPSLATINNGNSDQDLWFCNGTDNYDGNWGFGLMKGGTPYPRTADANNGGARGTSNITRWGIIGIKA